MPQIVIAKTVKIDQEYAKINCSDQVIIEIPKNTFNRPVFLSCGKLDYDEKYFFQNIKSINDVYYIKITDEFNNQITLSRNEIKAIWKIDNSEEIDSLSIYFFDDIKKIWLTTNTNINEKYLSAFLPKINYFTILPKQQYTNILDVYSLLAYIFLFISSIIILIKYFLKK